MKERIGNRYEFDRASGVIGRGGMGTVYLGIDTQTGMTVAIKQLLPDLVSNTTDFITRFMREAEVLRGLQHPNIINVYDTINDVELGHYLVMEYIGGGSLWDELQAKPQLPISRILTLAQDIASALIKVHEKNIIHRDIKPANVLIADDKSPRLSDFGVIYLQDRTRVTETGGLVGTFDYLAPEMLNGAGMTQQSDIWAFGVMLYEMVAGKRPFSGDAVSVTLAAIMMKPHPDLQAIRPDAPANLVRLIDWMLAKNPQDRVADMTIVHQSLVEIMNGYDLSVNIPTNRLMPFKRIGSLPKIFLDDPFYDRTQEQTAISNFLTESKPFIGVYGRGGIGKTALVSKVLGDFEKNLALDGVVYLRANSIPVLNGEILLDSLAKLLPESHDFHAQRTDNTKPFTEKVRLLLDGLSGGHYVVYIDNFETLQDPENHTITDDAIRDFLTVMLETRGNGVLSVIVTTRYPLPFANIYKSYEAVVRLDEGLPLAEAIQFLREMDKQGVLPVDDTQLGVWISKVGGFPRGLEALIGYLNGGETRHIDDLLDDPTLFEGEVLSNVVHQIHEALPQDFRRVMTGVAIIGQSTARTELDYLLSPYMDASRIRLILERLVDGRFLTYNRQNRTYSIHPIDRDYALSSTLKGSSDDADTPFTQYTLNWRMAEYCVTQYKPKAEWKTIDDIAPQLREIEYRYQCGEYDAIVLIFDSISLLHLFYWGYVELVIDWLLRLQDLVQKEEILLKVHSILLVGYWHLVNYSMSLHHAQIALNMAEQQQNEVSQATILGNIATIHYSRGKIEEAIVYIERAITLSQKTNNRTKQAIQLGNLGGIYYSLGEFEKAVDYYRKGLDISQEIGDKLNQSRQLSNLGEVMSILKRPDEAIPYLTESIRIAQDINAIAMVQNNWIFLARAYWLFADFNKGLEAIKQAFDLNHDNPDRQHYGMVLYGCLIWGVGHPEKAIEFFQDVIQLTDKVLAIASDNFEALYSRALAWAGLWIAKGEETYYQQAMTAYRTAVQTSGTKGTLFEKRQLLETLLTYTDKDGSGLLALLA
ncbi:MAG: protein kinase [bacterium]|nr:protein kinase [bacterium]